MQAVVALELDEMQQLPHLANVAAPSVASSMSEEQLARYASPPNESAGPGREQAALPAQEQAAQQHSRKLMLAQPSSLAEKWLQAMNQTGVIC